MTCNVRHLLQVSLSFRNFRHVAYLKLELFRRQGDPSVVHVRSSGGNFTNIEGPEEKPDNL